MPAKSKKQQRLMGMVHAYKVGKLPPEKASPMIKRIAKSITDKEAKDFAETSTKGLPMRKLGFHKYASWSDTLTVGAAGVATGLVPGVRGPEAAVAAKLAPAGKKVDAATSAAAFGLAGAAIPIMYAVGKYMRHPKAAYSSLAEAWQKKDFVRNATKFMGKYHLTSAGLSGVGSAYGYHRAVKPKE